MRVAIQELTALEERPKRELQLLGKKMYLQFSFSKRFIPSDLWVSSVDPKVKATSPLRFPSLRP